MPGYVVGIELSEETIWETTVDLVRPYMSDEEKREKMEKLMIHFNNVPPLLFAMNYGHRRTAM
ncbi:hypothetical protein DPMN_183017 [Dreissena polymorpha]|uniref:Uncharacterized protein n=1 Tax=Dreissena polymorpha TaxID=45954 RepID=A0A9D4I384_DREPO|nr:hypothetical protein DPMN_183017 [Dreissena polymorpha]